ncbi:MAG: transposase [Flavobacteriales bacterium]|nr:transposase [Flavobacteriales bacterium]
MTSEERQRRRFSEDFRKEQVKLIESGERTLAEVCKLYEVKRDSVLRWLKRYGAKKLPDRILITNGKEYDRIKTLESEVKKLKEIIGDQKVQLVIQEEFIRLAEDKLGEDFKKK